MIEQRANSIPPFTPKAWKKITPHTIDAWLLSDNKRDREFADEALDQMGEEYARCYLTHLLAGERRAQLIASWLSITFHSGASLAVLFGLFVEEPLRNPTKIFLTLTFLVTMTVFSRTTRIQRRILERTIAKSNPRDLSVLLACENPSDTEHQTAVSDAIVRFLSQVKEADKEAIPDSYWTEIIQSLEIFARHRWINGGYELGKAQISVCGKTRYEPALPTLKAVASMNAMTSDEKELKELATQYVATWDKPLLSYVPSAPLQSDQQVALSGKWYVS